MKQKNLILMVVAVGCGLVAAFLTTQINAKGPKTEQVEVLVAAKDLAVGTLMSKAELPKLVVKKTVPKDSLPANFVNDESELIDKRLSAPVPADGFFIPSTLSTRGVIILPEGKDMVSLPMTVSKSAAGFVGPGSHVDVLASMNVKNRLTAFPLLIDMQVLTVDTNTTYDKKGSFASMSMVSLAVTQEQALLLSMARKRGCDMELLLRHPNKPVDPNYNLNKIKQILQDDSPGAGVVVSERPEGGTHNDVPTPEGVPPSVPSQVTEAPKVVTVRVWKATAEIAANTEITKDLIAQSFTGQEVPKDIADSLQAYQDLTPCLGQVFKNPVEKGQLVIKGMVGTQTTKAPPAEPFIPDKATPAEPPLKVEHPKPVETKQVHDVALYGANGVMIHRYVEVNPGEWKLKKVMTPEEALREAKQGPGASPDTSPTPPTPDEKPSPSGTRKID